MLVCGCVCVCVCVLACVRACVQDYFDIVKQPMNLRLVRSRLEANYYSCFQECQEDMALIFSNCRLYNKPDDVSELSLLLLLYGLCALIEFVNESHFSAF